MAKKETGKVTKQTQAPAQSFDDGEFEEVRLGMDIRSITEETPTIRGIYLGNDVLKDADGNPKINEQYGNEMAYSRFKDLRTQDEFGVWMDGGLKGALNFNQVKPGMAVRVTLKGTKEVETNFGLKDIRQYEIAGLQPKGTAAARA